MKFYWILIFAFNTCCVLAYDFNHPTKPNIKVTCDDAENQMFNKIGQKYYFVGNSNVTWFEAAHTCRRFGGDLALIESAEEMKLISNYLESYNKNAWVWISGNDFVTTHRFMSIANGKPMPFTSWSKGQPDYPGIEQCVHLWFKDGAFRMNNWKCLSKANYLCQRQNYTRCRDSF